MIIYEDFYQSYKSPHAPHFGSISKQRLKAVTSKRVLSQKNIKFLKSLGLKVKK